MHVTPHELGVALSVKSHLITNCQETYFQALAMGLPEQRVNLFHNGLSPGFLPVSTIAEIINLSFTTVLYLLFY